MTVYETDEEFLGYVELHSQTERHAFHCNDADRLLEMAGEHEIFGTDNCGLPGFIGIDWGAAKPMVKKARKRLELK